MTTIELARCSTAAQDAHPRETAEEDMRRMTVVGWLFAALVTVPVVAIVWWAL